jgi:hypothetical protein
VAATDPVPLPTFAPGRTLDMLAAMHRDGCVLVPGVVPPDRVSDARRAIDRLTPIHWDFAGVTDHYKTVFNRDPFWLPFLDLSGVIDLAQSCLGANCHVIGQTAWRSHPGHRGVGLHLDYLAMELPPEALATEWPIPMFLCTAHVYLSDITIDLCPTYVIPGSHRAARRPGRWATDWQGRPPQPVLCAAGDVLFFRSDLWHSGSDNLTGDKTRYLLQVHYGRREFAHHFAPYLDWTFNPAVLAAATDRQKRLLGDHEPGAYD